ncbi:MAG: AEC family transporter [Acholeplasmatales bacterium]|nr:AEC family transporter [Acholeplasmatales bacterium]
MSNLMFTLNAVLPIIFCILIGYILKLLKIFPDSFWGTLNKLCFKIFLPLLLFKNIYDIKNIKDVGTYWKIILFCSIIIICFFIVGFIIVKLFVKDDKQKGVILQCIFRSNYAIIGIGLIELLAGDNQTAKGIGAVISAVSIPLFNILAILALTLFVKDENGNKIKIKDIIIKICKNPLIIGVLCGLIFLSIKSLIIEFGDYKYITQILTYEDGTTKTISDVLVNSNGKEVSIFLENKNCKFIYTTIKWLAQCASPCALVALGGAFTFSAVKKLKNQIILGVSLRIIAVPAIGLTIAYLLGFDDVRYFPALIALFGTPVAVSSVPMASEMNNDGELAGQLVVWCSLLSSITLFVIILISSAIGAL